LNIGGTVVDQKSEINPLQALLEAPSPENHEVLLRDIIEAIDYAAEDPAINSLVMELDSLGRLGISKTQEIVDALQNFRESGKPMVAIGDYYTQDQYLLASHADTVIAQLSKLFSRGAEKNIGQCACLSCGGSKVCSGAVYA
jgi:protease-4